MCDHVLCAFLRPLDEDDPAEPICSVPFNPSGGPFLARNTKRVASSEAAMSRREPSWRRRKGCFPTQRLLTHMPSPLGSRLFLLLRIFHFTFRKSFAAADKTPYIYHGRKLHDPLQT